MQANNTPTALILSRQDLPVIDSTKYAAAENALQGGYVLADAGETPAIILIATGSEVQFAIAAYEQLKQEGIKARVVSMPNAKLFQRQSPEYQNAVLPATVRKRIAIEAGATFGWEVFVGLPGDGEVIGMTTFGASGKIDALYKEFGITTEAIIKTAKKLINNN